MPNCGTTAPSPASRRDRRRAWVAAWTRPSTSNAPTTDRSGGRRTSRSARQVTSSARVSAAVSASASAAAIAPTVHGRTIGDGSVTVPRSTRYSRWGTAQWSSGR